MKRTPYTDFFFELKGRKTITLIGNNTEDNLEKAISELVKQFIDCSWIEDCKAKEYYEYEDEND